MKRLVKTGYIIFSLILVFYLFLPNFDFPEPPPDALHSNEPGDTETPLRRAYFTDFTREEVMLYHKGQLEKSNFLGVPLPTYRLNYPPEEAQTLIRDQTRSTFLEEIVHPFRESFFVNGFQPKEEKDIILIAGKVWRQKITVRYVPSSYTARLAVAFVVLVLIWIISDEWRKGLKSLIERKN